MYPWVSKLLYVDLSNRDYRIVNIDNPREHIGGRGFASRYLFDELEPDTDPLDPENVLIFSAGLLTGTLYPGASRMSVTSKSYINSGFGSTNVGDFMASEMKFSGFDHIVIRGRSESPVYLAIHDQKIEIRDAHAIWGKTTWQAEDYIRKDLNSPRVRVATIGQAGENLCKPACIILDKGRSASWFGCGSIMGSKNLKAIAIKGSGNIEVAMPDQFMKEVREAWRRIRASRTMQHIIQYGTIGVSGGDGLTTGKPQGVRNLSDGQWEGEKTLRLKDVVFRVRFPGPHYSCFVCPTPCSRSFRIAGDDIDENKVLAIHSNQLRGFGANLDIDKPDVVLKASSLVTQYGLNVDEVSATIAWAFEAWERGLINKEDTGGLTLGWGNDQALLKLIKQIAFREGFGDILADGVKEASKRIGRGTEEFAVSIKDAGVNERGLREYIGWSFGIATSVRGGGHLNGAPLTENRSNTEEFSMDKFGIKTAFKPEEYEGKETLVTFFNNLKISVDSMGVCWFHSYCYDENLLEHEVLARAARALTGEDIDKDELFHLGKKTISVEKCFNILHAGFNRKDDIPHKRFFEDSVTIGAFKGASLDINRWNDLLSRYYKLNEWDEKTGWPTRALLDKLGLKDVLSKLDRFQKSIK